MIENNNNNNNNNSENSIITNDQNKNKECEIISENKNNLVEKKNNLVENSFFWMPEWGPWSTTNTNQKIKIKTNFFDDNKYAIDKTISTTRTCGMVFAVPKIRLTSAPFSVSVIYPTICYKNEIISFIIVVSNKLWSAEHLLLSINTNLNLSSTSSSSSSSTSSSSTTNNNQNNNNNNNQNQSSENKKSDLSVDSSIGSSSSGFLVVGNTSSLMDVSTAIKCYFIYFKSLRIFAVFFILFTFILFLFTLISSLTLFSLFILLLSVLFVALNTKILFFLQFHLASFFL